MEDIQLSRFFLRKILAYFDPKQRVQRKKTSSPLQKKIAPWINRSWLCL